MAAAVKSVTLDPGRDRPWTGGLRRRRYTIVYTDEQAIDHTVIEMPVNVDAADDGSLVASRGLARLQKQELSRYIKRIMAGVPVDFLAARWNDSSALFRAVAREAFLIDGTHKLALEFISYVDALTDAQLRTIFNKTQSWVVDIRARAVKINAIKAARDDYIPGDIS